MRFKSIFLEFFSVLIFWNFTLQFELVVNDEEIENPKAILKSTFKKYIPLELQDNLEIPIKPGQTNIRESFISSAHNNFNNNNKQLIPLPPPSRPFENRKYAHKLKSLFKKNKLKSSFFNGISSTLSTTASTASQTDLFEVETDEVTSEELSVNDEVNSTSSIELGINSVSFGVQSNSLSTPATTTVSTSTLTSISTSTLTSNLASSTPTILTIQSHKSWIKEFLQFKKAQDLQTQQNLKNIRSSTGGEKLKSKITEYEDSLNNPKDLKKWVRLIANNENLENTPKKQYLKNINQEIEIDINEFINYLVTEQSFNPQDLQFLKFKNLDYGLNEIEQELNKLKEVENSQRPKVIKIGGEDGSVKNNDGSSNIIGLNYSIYLVFMLTIIYLVI
ncbi:uncharacterized protein KGF55_001457 [Candida pseudojiufengensis]|uniref:uncharacterized protein n=1 Tax=Candida pseudojiufengensis TaxID=497109 RepID=UPI0022253AAD|nr:uncharacterized protein KGF55_001457 [Candida pseudojiufengensis]KAI5965237.1 hypothetical protein KGF55_001457 [Candida pseudojiufengensis]